eukprot:CAMPEP_0175829312 /NCGR_PEP_ID=MMETSP0107_2-20121207/13270_1 /TAXON_ID=195067 ORGANISM="Goniomonas pacifica, Strain CCMP1869" /NCGR_SAMPLE_ID=MMETSP0107_2 /ASSEMBLY_ACC=CAM_ASM_000203 /LENGTH=96 /DNA_ID=CAMNT_0017142087 /DNA_START=197 /DNA_END=487 /DNA_ORIENTATION=+
MTTAYNRVSEISTETNGAIRWEIGSLGAKNRAQSTPGRVLIPVLAQTSCALTASQSKAWLAGLTSTSALELDEPAECSARDAVFCSCVDAPPKRRS